MDQINKNKIVIFGAGKIGRSFIGQLFSLGGYEVVFIDINKALIEELVRRGRYPVIVKSVKDETIWVNNVRGVSSDDHLKVAGEIASAGIMSVSAGLSNLHGIIPLIAYGLIKRYELFPNEPLDIIIAENMRDASAYFRSSLTGYLPGDYPVDRLMGLVETSIGKMVPIMLKRDTEADILQIFAEPYNTLILDKKAFKNPIPSIDGLAPKDNMKAWVDRKLYIHNLGHASAAYIGYLENPEFIYLYEVLARKKIFIAVRETMMEAARILLKIYPEEFTSVSLRDHIDDLLERFQNRALGDTIFRVGCDLRRKLGKDDRLAGAIRLGFELGLPYSRILYALVCATHFRAADENGMMLPDDKEFEEVYSRGIDSVLTEICGFNTFDHKDIFMKASEIDQSIKI